MSASLKDCLPEGLNVSRGAIESLARHVAVEHGIVEGRPLDAVMRTMGIEVSHGMEPAAAGSPPIRMVRLPGRRAELMLNATSGHLHDREVMGIALGAFLMHMPADRCTIMPAWPPEGEEGARRAHIEALWFMSELLMPAEAFAAPPGRAEELAARHGVTPRSARIRMDGIAERDARAVPVGAGGAR